MKFKKLNTIYNHSNSDVPPFLHFAKIASIECCGLDLRFKFFLARVKFIWLESFMMILSMPCLKIHGDLMFPAWRYIWLLAHSVQVLINHFNVSVEPLHPSWIRFSGIFAYWLTISMWASSHLFESTKSTTQKHPKYNTLYIVKSHMCHCRRGSARRFISGSFFSICLKL